MMAVLQNWLPQLNAFRGKSKEVAGFAAGIHIRERIGQKNHKDNFQCSPSKRGGHA